mgnify:CR=1 FL=1
MAKVDGGTIPGRLEILRHATGLSLRAFHARLADGWCEDLSLSYQAARRYHKDRDPPVAYLVRVSEVYPEVRMEWLAAGLLPMWKEKEPERCNECGQTLPLERFKS